MATSCSCGNNAVVDKKRDICEPQKPGKAIMSCGCGSAGPLPATDLAGASIRNPYAVASVTINTEELRCPTVLIHVTALINSPLGVIPNIIFRVVKGCNNSGTQLVGGSYAYASAIDLLEGKTFEFQLCDTGECCGCCTYTVEISNATLAQAGTTVSAQISAIAVERLC